MSPVRIQVPAATRTTTPKVNAVFCTTVSIVIRPVPASTCVLGRPAPKSAYAVPPLPLNPCERAKTGLLLCMFAPVVGSIVSSRQVQNERTPPRGSRGAASGPRRDGDVDL